MASLNKSRSKNEQYQEMNKYPELQTQDSGEADFPDVPFYSRKGLTGVVFDYDKVRQVQYVWIIDGNQKADPAKKWTHSYKVREEVFDKRRQRPVDVDSETLFRVFPSNVRRMEWYEYFK